MVAELRLDGVATIEAANALLGRYLPEHNRRFGVPPRQQAAVWPAAHCVRQLDRVLCL